MKKIIFVFSFLIFVFNFSFAQQFTHADTLRGSNGPGRYWWNATKYDLYITFDFKDSSITGYNAISYKILDKKHPDFFQIDLQEPMIIDSVIWETGSENYPPNRKKLSFTRDGNAWFVYLNSEDPPLIAKHDINKIMQIKQGPPKVTTALDLVPEISNLIVYYHGKPRKAKRAPWDGGFVWERDNAGNPWVAVACQGLGASVWYPCKDYQGDEPDSAEMNFTAPSDLITVSNGRLRSVKVNGDGNTTYDWAVVNPINNYDITFYIGKFVTFGNMYHGLDGNLTMDYWVLDSNLTKAKIQFTDAPRMMKAFEYWFGPYPFYKDGYKLVDAPYLGMEHQSGIGYGNNYQNGYNGTNYWSSTQWSMKWDFIIVHESGHEWFGNNITAKDIADNWIHESFTSYSEVLFTEYYYGEKAGEEYIIGSRKRIKNEQPIIGNYGVNEEGDIDIYYKGANMIHTIRQVINNDEKFRGILRGLNKTFYHQTVTSKQVEDYISKQSGINFSKVFDQYLRTTKVPDLEYKTIKGKLFYRWGNCVAGFNMPVKIYDENGKLIFIHPTQKFKKVPKGVNEIKVDENFYVNAKDVNN